MRLLVELSAEHDTLPAAELAAVAELAGGQVVERDGAAALVEAPEGAADFLRRRMALAHAVAAHWWSTAATPRVMVPPFGRIDLKGASFAVRARRLEGKHPELPLSDTVKAIGAILAVSGKVDLERPEVEIRLLLSEEAHVGAHLGDVDRKAFEARHLKHRAYFAPVSLHPRYARTLVNLARVREGERVADPFVGTGGLVLEAGLAGARVYAGDLDPRMVAGTRDTLRKFGVAVVQRGADEPGSPSSRGADVQERDVGELPEWTGGSLDVVLSDPPYGRSSTTNQEPMRDLYARFFAAAHAALRPGGRLAVIFPSDELRQRALEHGFRLLEAHDQRVHRSMTRHWAVYARD